MNVTYSIYAVEIRINQNNVQTGYTVRPSGAVDTGTEIESGFNSREQGWKRVEEIREYAVATLTSEQHKRAQDLEEMLSGIPGL